MAEENVSSFSTFVDTPLNYQYSQNDILKIDSDSYQEALIKFLRRSDTPISIAIQGEWGSGKTSLMNILKYRLCEASNSIFYPVWINTWHFSLANETTPQQAVVDILKSIILQIGKINKNNSNFISNFIDIAKKLAINVGPVVVEEAAGAVSEKLSLSKDFGKNIVKATAYYIKGNQDPVIKELRDNAEGLIQEIMSHKDNNNRGFIFFIDDLDRIPPVLSVRILEILNNVFNIKNCIFILAVDYEAIVQGLKPKLGNLSKNNEQKFRSYFDKLIQLPLSIPLQIYDIGAFVKQALEQVDYFSKEELTDNIIIHYIVLFVQLSVGMNPRLLKKLINTVSFLNYVRQERELQSNNNTEDTEKSPWEKVRPRLMIFALACLQISYPSFYSIITHAPNFMQWSKDVADELRIPIVDIPESIKQQWEISTNWKIVLYSYCVHKEHLFNDVFNILEILQKINSFISNDPSILAEYFDALEVLQITNIGAQSRLTLRRSKFEEQRRLSKQIEQSLGRVILD